MENASFDIKQAIEDAKQRALAQGAKDTERRERQALEDCAKEAPALIADVKSQIGEDLFVGLGMKVIPCKRYYSLSSAQLAFNLDGVDFNLFTVNESGAEDVYTLTASVGDDLLDSKGFNTFNSRSRSEVLNADNLLLAISELLEAKHSANDPEPSAECTRLVDKAKKLSTFNYYPSEYHDCGASTRLELAKVAMAGLISRLPVQDRTPEEVSSEALHYADALIELMVMGDEHA